MLLDFPYAYKLDGNKLYCTANNPQFGVCGGEIDYDDGFNFLRCTKCGTRYKVRQLAKDIKDENIIVKGKKKMEVKVIRGKGITQTFGDSDGFKEATAKVEPRKNSTINIGELSVSTVCKKKVEKKPNNDNHKKDYKNNNNGYRSNNHKSYNNNYNRSGFDRGIVRASGDEKLSVSIKTSELKENEAKIIVTETPCNCITDAKFKEYDAERDIMIFTSGDMKISADLSSIPEDIMENFVALSGVGKELEQAKEDLHEQEDKYAEKVLELEDMKNAVNAYDELSKKCSTLETRIESLTNELESVKHERNSLKERLSESTLHSVNDSNEITELKAKIEELESKLANADKDKKESVEFVERILAEVEIENEQLKTAINLEPLEAVENFVMRYEIDGGIFASAIILKISELIDVKEEDDHYVLALLDGENSYMGDTNNNFLLISTINGRTIDDIMTSPKKVIEVGEHKVEIQTIESESTNVEEQGNTENEEKSVIEVKEAPVGSIQQ